MENDISAQTSIPVNTVGITFSKPNNFVVKVNYGNGIVDPVYYLPNPTVASCIIEIVNSNVQPSVKCEYYDGSSWINTNTQTGVFTTFLIDSGMTGFGVTSHIWTYEVSINSSANLTAWGGKTFRIILDQDFVDGDKIPFVIYTSNNFGFETDFGTPPSLKFLSQPQDVSLSPSGANLTALIKAYSSSITGNWQYSDNYSVSNPVAATWANITESSIGMEEQLTALIGDMIGYGSLNGISYTVVTSTLSVNVSAFVAGRKYRYKVVAL
jgi:hypothetical protein